MKISLEKASGRSQCRYLKCECKEDYISDGKIKKGTICARITFDSAGGRSYSYYCRDCIDKIYNDVKLTLNSSLWIFK